MEQRNKDQLLDASLLFYTQSNSRSIQSRRGAEMSCWQGAVAQPLP